MIEKIGLAVSAERARVALFDFDGTLSLIRAGLMDVMVPMMVEIMLDLKTGKSDRAAPRYHHAPIGRRLGRARRHAGEACPRAGTDHRAHHR